jgi:hypothetical protein
VKDGYRLALIGGFVQEEGQEARVADLGFAALAVGEEDDPSEEVRRLLVSTLMLRRPPAWVAYWQGDPSSLDLVVPEGDRELLESAGLLPPESGDLRRRAWWLALGAVPLPDQLQSLRKAIGDAGEELSYRYEKARLRAQGFPQLAESVTWVSKESPAYGFDIASFAGSSFPGREANGPLAIEVKSVSYPVGVVFPFHLTFHEWATASELDKEYVFHLWSCVRTVPEAAAATNEPRITVVEKVARHVLGASACGGRCRWDSMLVELPLTRGGDH